ncbi:DinB family protein [Cognatiyoonia koreensis]|nr:DinB family protein [Cognatiyoonia koreensis]
MARYNTWQNSGLRDVVDKMSDAELRKDRGAFFGSVMATLNHLLWGDMIWMSRFDMGEAPPGGITESVHLTPTKAVWAAERFRMDGRITEWARHLKAIDLAGDLNWTNTNGEAKTDRMWVCVTHFFNHQTHHRGQVHAMLTAAGQTLPATDIPALLDRH